MTKRTETIADEKTSEIIDEKTGEKTDEYMGERPFEERDENMDAQEIEQYMMQGWAGVAVGAEVPDTSDALPPLIDQEDLMAQPFVVFQVRLQDKVIEVNGQRMTDYTMAIVAGQAVNLDAQKRVIETGAIFVMIAGRDDSVLGREMLMLAFEAKPSAPVLFSNGLRRVELGNGQRYYTSRAERQEGEKIDLFAAKRNA